MASLGLIIVVVASSLLVAPLARIFVDRTVNREGIAKAARCNECGTELTQAQMVPFISWFSRCTNCGDRFEFYYRVSDIFVVLVPVVMVLGVAAPELGVYVAAAWILAVLMVIDFEHHLLPNVLVWPLNFAVAIAIAAFTLTVSELNWVSALVGASVFAGILFLMFVVYPKGLGFGDVKLAITLGALVGWLQPTSFEALRITLYAFAGSMLLGGLGGLLWNIAMKRGRAEVPFGPALVAASAVTIILS